MNLVIMLSLIAFSSGAQLKRAYLPPHHSQTSGGSDVVETPIVVADEAVVQKSGVELNNHVNHQQAFDEYIQIGNHGNRINQNAERHHIVEEENHGQHFNVAEQAPERSQAALERHAAVLRQDFENNVESYAYVYETENGLYGEENGIATDGVKAHGSFSYTGDDGKQYTITYTADENGFRPQGDHLPTPHPIPEEILKSLEDNARDEAAGIYDDGSYNKEKYGDKTAYTNNYHAHDIIINEHELAVNDADTIITDSAIIPVPVTSTSLPVISTTERIESHDLHTIANIPSSHANKVYLPPTNYQFIKERTYNGNLDRFINDNIVRKTYLPPTHHQVIEDKVSQSGIADQVNDNNVARKTYLPPIHQQVIEDGDSQIGMSRQVIAHNAARKTYLPPVKRQNIQETESHHAVFKQVNNSARKTYLPPVQHQAVSEQVISMKTYLPSINNRPQNAESQGVASNGDKTYLPPSSQILENKLPQSGQFVFGTKSRQPSFNSRSGYQY